MPPSNKGLLVTFVQSTLGALLLAFLVHYVSTQFPSKTKLDPDCAAIGKPESFSSYADFYAYYLCEHTQPTTKLFHFVATFNVLVFLLTMLKAKAASTKLRVLIFAIVQAYTLAWISHFNIEMNKPATFQYPLYSFASDWVMFRDALLGRVSLF